MTKKSEEFVEANQQLGVIEGWATGSGGQGGSYKLSDGRVFKLSLEDCLSLPPEYPIWEFSRGF
jgi:hypothetical protein